MAMTPSGTATPTPTFAPVLRPLDAGEEVPVGDTDDDVEEDRVDEALLLVVVVVFDNVVWVLELEEEDVDLVDELAGIEVKAAMPPVS